MGTSASATPGTKGEIFTFGSDVKDITGFKLQLLLNYRDKNSSEKADHPPGDAPLASGIGLIWTVSGLGSTPLSELFDKLWSGNKDKDGKTMHDRAVETAMKEIAKGGGSTVTGTIPKTGKLRALVVGDEMLLLSYWLPGANFGFHEGPLGAAWSLTFNIELFISIAFTPWPKPVVAGQVNVLDADISAANVGAALDDAVKTIGHLVTDQPLALYQSQEGQIDSTSPRPPDLGPLTTFLNDLGKAAVPLGFLKAIPSVDSKGSTLDLRIFHAVDSGPKLGNTAKQDEPQLQAPAISANLVQVAAGKDVTVNGMNFPDARADAFYIGWNDTVTGDITESHIQWSAKGKQEQHVVISRKPFDGKNSYIATGLLDETDYEVQVRDADQLTFTDWSNKLDIKTGKSDAVNLSLRNGATVALGTAKRDTSGSFVAKVKVPAGTTPGKHAITAADGSHSANTSIEVLGPGQSPIAMLVALGSDDGVINGPVSAMEGATLTLRGEGFQAGTVALSIQGGASLGQATAGADGTFAAKAHLPKHAGALTLVASQTVGGQSAQATLAVSVLAPPT